MHPVTRRMGPVVVAVCVPLLLETCKSSEAPSVPTTIVLTPSTFTFATLGRTQPFTAVVKDQNGNPLATAKVVWSTTNGAVVTIDTTGVATAVANGSAQIKATSGAASQPAAITVGQVAAQIVKDSGDAQTGAVGTVLAQKLVVHVADSAAHLIAGDTVTFAVTAGAGSLGTAKVATDAGGKARTTWTLGTVAGSQSVSASAPGGAPPAAFSATANAGGAKTVAKQAGDAQTTTTGAAVAIAPAVLVRDSFNNAKPGVTVTFSVPNANDGSVTGPTQVTNAAGVATVGSWALGIVGTDSLLATVGGLAPVVFTATSQSAGTPANVASLVGGNEPGLVGFGVNTRPAVVVTNAAHNPVPGVGVTFAVTAGGGSVTGGTATTNANGVAQVTKWTLGAAAGVNSMTATVSGSGIAGNPVAFNDTAVVGQFTIQLQYFGNYTPTATEQAAFDSAVAKWQRIIYRHLGGTVTVLDTTQACGAGEPKINTPVTDVLILASFDSIDGPGQTLAEAFPCYLRLSNAQTVLGVMKFDTADVGGLISSGQLNEVVLHEMNHVLGFGTLWSLAGSPFPDPNCLQLPSNPPGTLLDTYFSCATGTHNALAEFDSVGGNSYTGAGQTVGGNKVPVENCANSPYVSPTCGIGTVNSHWRETVLGNELMTGFINAGTNPLSVVSVAAEQDLGYTVNYDAADPYTHTFTAPAALGVAPLFLGNDVPHGPLYAVDESGRIRAVLRR